MVIWTNQPCPVLTTIKEAYLYCEKRYSPIPSADCGCGVETGKSAHGAATDETPAQQEGSGKNPARFAVVALQDGRATNALIKPLRSRTVEQSALSSPLRRGSAADGGTAAGQVFWLAAMGASWPAWQDRIGADCSCTVRTPQRDTPCKRFSPFQIPPMPHRHAWCRTPP